MKAFYTPRLPLYLLFLPAQLHSQLWQLWGCVPLWGSMGTTPNAQLHCVKGKLSCSAALSVFEDDQPREWAGWHPSNTARSPGRGSILTGSQKSSAATPSSAACTSLGWDHHQQQQPAQICSWSKLPLPSALLRERRTSPKARLDGALSTLVLQKVSLSMVGGVELQNL